MLEHFVQSFSQIYDPDSVSSNIHNLYHMIGDVKNVGPLSVINALLKTNSVRLKICLEMVVWTKNDKSNISQIRSKPNGSLELI